MCMLLDMSSEKSKNEVEKTIPFTTAWKRIQYLGINVTNKALLEESKDLKKWKDVPKGHSCAILFT